ncbi:Hypothetical predicted protein [Mytilus galloprovincialis]|uniref:Death domain-containing protein n=1 Tax=Mytilus galloprovincialis TaxID=29158 RepID=A0A8B6GLP4_MYTGA|nr:Hypothetical predicted protein [Mytilus galloprovincialis]
MSLARALVIDYDQILQIMQANPTNVLRVHGFLRHWFIEKQNRLGTSPTADDLLNAFQRLGFTDAIAEYERLHCNSEPEFEQGHSLHTMHTEPETHGSIPAIILRMDNESIEIYKKALESGSEIKHDIRIIIVGKKGAGKTSLVRNLLKENLDNVDSTNGIDIHVKRCKIRTADGKWFLQEGSFISDVSQRMLRSMIIQTRMNTFPENERKNEYGEEFEEEDTANQSEDTHDLNIVEEATDYVQRRNIQSLTKVDELVRKQKSSHATDNQHDIDLREMIDSARDMDDEEYASLSFWDFAGDREFYNTHQTFLSEEAIYLVVTKLNETDDETNETLKFWFDSIHFYGTPKQEKQEDIEQVNRPLPSSSTGIKKGCIGNSSTQIYDFHDIADSKGKPAFPTYLEPPIIAIGTHKDQCMGNFKDKLVNQIKNNLGDSAARQHLRNCHYISNTTNDDNIFEALRQNIYEIAKSRQGFGKLMPVRFIQLEKYIDRKLQAGRQFLSFGDLKALAEKIGAITDIGELDVFLRYHHDFGNLIYFKDIPEYIILNPQWLANVFCLLVTADKFRDNLIWHNELETYETTGKLTENLLHCIFENQSEGIIKCKKHILKIMEKFDIIVRPRMLIDGEEKIDDHYYVPCMIKSVASKNIQNQLNPQQKSYCLCLQFNFLPPAFINHVIISCIRKYPTSQFREEKKNPRPALFRHTGLFDIQCCKKLLVASINNFIQFQIWKYDCKCQTSSKQIGKILLEQVDQIIHESYGLFRISYDVKMKCESTSYDCFDGLIKPIENGLWYFCYEHNGTHIYRDDWFSEHAMTKKTAECQTEQENTIIAQKKDEDRFCFEIHVQKNTNKVASSAEEMNMAKMVKVALNILADVLFDLLKLETYGNPAYLLQSRKQCDITFLYGEHRRMNKHKPSNSSKRRCPWGGEWTDIAGTDNALGDDIERIRLTRNELQHMKFFALDDTRYTELCTILQDVLNRFDKHINPSHLYTDRLNEILKNTVEREDVECFKLEIKSKL